MRNEVEGTEAADIGSKASHRNNQRLQQQSSIITSVTVLLPSE